MDSKKKSAGESYPVFEAARKQTGRRGEQELPANEKREKYQEALKRATPSLKASFEHPGNRCSVPGLVSAPCSPDDYDEIDEVLDREQSEHEKKQPTVCHRDSHMPPEDSPLYTYLSNIRKKVQKKDGELMRQIRSGVKWMPPPCDPLSKGLGSSPKPDNWYLGSCWVYIWLPLLMFPTYLSEKHTCAFCAKTNTESKGLVYRPMIEWMKTVWILSQRVVCLDEGCCGRLDEKGNIVKSFYTIDPLCLSRLHPDVVERFDFVTSRRGPGMHNSMIYSLAHLCNHSVFSGTFSSMVNEMRSVDYSKQQLSYYKSLQSWDPVSAIGYRGQDIIPYSAFSEPGEHNGIRLSAARVANSFSVFMEKVLEVYMQGSFECNQDEQIAIDATFKYWSKVQACLSDGSQVKPFVASANVMNGAGKIIASLPVYGKGQDEVEPMLERIQVARRAQGAPKLKRFDTDNVKGDNNMVNRVFEGVVESPSCIFCTFLIPS